MTINYREPYWLKFQWDLSTHHENQYVTEFNKSENQSVTDFFYNENFIITCNFKIEDNYEGEDVRMIFGKSGKNMGLSYNKPQGELCFEFWTTTESEDCYNNVVFKSVTKEDIEKGMTVSIIRDENRITVYKNFVEDNHIDFDNEFVDDYKRPGLFIGCCSPSPHSNTFGGFTKIEMNHFSLISKTSNIKDSKSIYEKETDVILKNRFYDDIVCLYDFKTVNNLGIVYDESKNSNFLEKVPKEFII
jgi:hypothetical protein